MLSTKQAFWYELSGKKRKKKSLQRHGIVHKPLFRDSYTPAILQGVLPLLVAVKETISRFWKMHAHSRGS